MTRRDVYRQLSLVNQPNGWFEIYQLPDQVYAIYEPHHFQEVISYLILGTERAVLFDTGMGIGDLPSELARLTALPITAINSHVHFDHVGANHRFDQVLVYDHPAALARAALGYSQAELRPHGRNGQFTGPLPAGFDPNRYVIPPWQPAPVQNGQCLDLGKRTIEILHTPGHSPDSVMLLDRDNGLLFTGDSYYPGPLYAHFQGDVYGYSHLDTYARSIRTACQLVPGLRALHPSHNQPVVEPGVLLQVATALEQLAQGEAAPGIQLQGDLTVASLPNQDQPTAGYQVPTELYQYPFAGFSIIAGRCHR